MHPYELNRTLGYLASLVILCRREMRTALREAAVEVMCTEQIEVVMTVRRIAGVLVVMEVILVILVTQGIRVIVEIMEIVEITIKGGAEA